MVYNIVRMTVFVKVSRQQYKRSVMEDNVMSL